MNEIETWLLQLNHWDFYRISVSFLHFWPSSWSIFLEFSFVHSSLKLLEGIFKKETRHPSKFIIKCRDSYLANNVLTRERRSRTLNFKKSSICLTSERTFLLPAFISFKYRSAVGDFGNFLKEVPLSCQRTVWVFVKEEERKAFWRLIKKIFLCFNFATHFLKTRISAWIVSKSKKNLQEVTRIDWQYEKTSFLKQTEDSPSPALSTKITTKKMYFQTPEETQIYHFINALSLFWTLQVSRGNYWENGIIVNPVKDLNRP